MIFQTQTLRFQSGTFGERDAKLMEKRGKEILFSKMARADKYDKTTVKGRLLIFLREKRMSQTEFGHILGVAPTYVGAMRKSLSLEKVNRLMQVFPDLSRDWLLYGEGEMLRDPDASGNGSRGGSRGECEVPLLPVAAYAGNLQFWSNPVQLADCEKIVSPVKGADFAIRVTGDSMEPEFHNGTTILIKKINEKAFIPWGTPMVIDTENGVLVKEVFPGIREGGEQYIEARSLNPKYPPLSIPSASIYGFYRVLGAIRIYSTY